MRAARLSLFARLVIATRGRDVGRAMTCRMQAVEWRKDKQTRSDESDLCISHLARHTETHRDTHKYNKLLLSILLFSTRRHSTSGSDSYRKPTRTWSPQIPRHRTRSTDQRGRYRYSQNIPNQTRRRTPSHGRTRTDTASTSTRSRGFRCDIYTGVQVAHIVAERRNRHAVLDDLTEAPSGQYSGCGGGCPSIVDVVDKDLRFAPHARVESRRAGQ